MQDFHRTMFPEISDRNGSFKPLRLTSASYEFPHCAMLSRNLSDRIALILYYAQVMNQKKILDNFFELCRYNFGNKCQHNLLESSINAWIQNSTVNLHRRREVILSENVSTLQIQLIFAISQVVFDVFCKYLVDSGEKRHVFSMDGRLKRQYNTNLDVLFHNNEVFLPFASCFNSLFHCLKENNKMSISRTDSLQLLRKFWSEFYFQPDPTQHIRFVHRFHEGSEESDSSTDMTNIFTYDVAQSKSDLVLVKYHTSENFSSTQLSSNVHETKPSTQQSAESSESSKSSNILPNSHDSCNTTSGDSVNTKPSIDFDLPPAVLVPTSTLNDIIQNYCAMDNTTEHSDDDKSSMTSESNSNSSGSWSCNDFNDDSDDHLQSYSSQNNSLTKFNDDSINSDDHHQSTTSKNNFLAKCNATIEWLQSTNCHFDSEEDNVNFSEALTEDNCMGSPSSRGSLNFVDCSDDEDEYEVIFFDRYADGHFENDAFGNMGQGFENPCFEDSFGAFQEPSFIEIVNECWNDDMMDLKYKPRKPSKVSFAPEPSLVTVQYFEKVDENTFDVSLVLDNLRFQQRINELGQMLSPFLTIEHRMDVLKRNCFHEG